jgi:RimJ/RimL family protein N-acetyltransferase
MRIPPLSTPRLLIREYTLADLKARYTLTQEAFNSTAPRESYEEWLQWTVLSYKNLDQLSQPPYGDYAIVEQQSGLAIGSIGLVPSMIPYGVFANPPHTPLDLSLTPEFGLFWAIRPAYQRRGYAVEAGRAFIKFLFEKLQIKQVIATTEYDNVASQGVMLKLDMTLRRNSYPVPHWFQVMGILTRENWLDVRAR